MKEIEINKVKYELIKNEREGFDLEETASKLTDYFDTFDYIVGDWAYGKLRLKGFYDSKNNECKSINNIEFVDKYIKDNCAYNCKHFILKKSVQK